jgi:hypothetical protein
MSNIITELGEQPPAGTILLLQLGTLMIRGPEGKDTALWNVTSWYSEVPQEQRNPQALQAAIDARFPQGFRVAHSVSSDELSSATHTALALARYFRCPQTLRVMIEDDPLARRLPSTQQDPSGLNHTLYAHPPSAYQADRPPADGTPLGQEGSGLRQTGANHSHPLGWFVEEILRLTVGEPSLEPVESHEPVVMAPPAAPIEMLVPQQPNSVIPVPPTPVEEDPVLHLMPGAVAPLHIVVPTSPTAPVPAPAHKAAPKKAAPKKAAPKKSAKSENGVGSTPKKKKAPASRRKKSAAST